MDSRLSGNGYNAASVDDESCVWAEGSTPSTSTNFKQLKLNIMRKFKHTVLLILAKAKQFREFLGPAPRETRW